MIRIRLYRPDDAAALADLYHRSVHELGLRRYTPEQVQAWSPAPRDPFHVHARCGDGRTVLVAVDVDDRPIAYADLEADGHIDHFYAAPEAAGTGVAGELLGRLIVLAREQDMRRLFVEGSEVARGLFERNGFTLVERRDFEVRGVAIHNYRLERPVD